MNYDIKTAFYVSVCCLLVWAVLDVVWATLGRMWFWLLIVFLLSGWSRKERAA
jgi:Flp pilus assembly protein TadB